MSIYAKTVFGDTTQSNPQFGKEQVKNNAGGYVYKLDDWKVLDRFLILGCENNTYYSKASELTIKNAQNVLDLIKKDGHRVVDKVVEISDAGRAAKNNTAIFVLAMVASFGNNMTKSYALSKLDKVARTATHLFQFVDDTNKMRGWGRGLRRAVGKWYTEKDTNSLIYQLIKYKNREGWTHKDVIAMAHPKPETHAHEYIFKTLFKGFNAAEYLEQYVNMTDMDRYIIGANFSAIVENDVDLAIDMIKKYNFPREVVPTSMLNNAKIWDALLSMGMPMTAMIRNLGKMSSVGLLTPMSAATKLVCDTLSNAEIIRKARIHPVNVLAAKVVYEAGHGYKGSNSWNVLPTISAALENAFYLAFKNVEPTGLRHFIGLDVSGSMTCPGVAGYEFLTPEMVNAAMVMSLMRSESQYHVMGFGSQGYSQGYRNSAEGVFDVGINAKMALSSVLSKISNINGGGTDCALPMVYALKHKIPVDVFSVWTDNETWAGNIHPDQALRKYRDAMGIDAKLVVCASTATQFTIADPKDPGMLDICGFDSAVPQVIREFSLGNL